jgi:hypothetical protein
MSTKQKEASKETSKKIAKLKDEKKFKEFQKSVEPVVGKKEGRKKELAMIQLEDALTKGDKSNLSMKGVKKVADAAADDKQLTKSLEKFERDLFRGGGRAGYKAGSKGCKLAMKGKGRAYGKNS